MSPSKMLALCFLCLSLSACMTPRYQDHSRSSVPQQQAMNPHDINFRLSSNYDLMAPQCVFILPQTSQRHPKMTQIADRTLARHLGEKIERILFPKRTDQIARQQGLDLQNAKDRRRFARMNNCPGYAKVQLYDLGDDFALIYSQKHAGLKIDFFHIDQELPIWQAAHTVWRGDGGLPLSPFSAAGGIAKAALFDQNEEILYSLMDDAVRRMIRTLPATY